jgi:hypothetical protein
LIRTALVLLAILASGLVFSQLTSKQNVSVAAQSHGALVEELISARFYLTLSELAESASIQSGNKVLTQNALKNGLFTGEISIDPKSPVVYLKVDWADLGGRHGFAKLVIEAAGRNTITQVFDAKGNIDDFLELSF